MHAANYFENAMLNLFRGTQITAPAKVYLALFLTDPTDTGTAGTELSYTNYARQEVTFSAPEADGSGGMVMKNAVEIGFPECLTDAGTVTHAAIMDAATGGHMLLHCPLESELPVTPGIAPVFRAGSVSWQWDGIFPAAIKAAVMNTLRNMNMAGIATPYIAFCNGDPTAGGAEFSGNDYARIPVTFSAPQQVQSGAGQISNTQLVLAARASAIRRNLTHIAIMDAATAGNICAVIEMPNPMTVKAGMIIGFRAGELKITAD